MILMRTLRKDYARYSRDEELDDLVREGGREGGRRRGEGGRGGREEEREEGGRGGEGGGRGRREGGGERGGEGGGRGRRERRRGEGMLYSMYMYHGLHSYDREELRPAIRVVCA